MSVEFTCSVCQEKYTLTEKQVEAFNTAFDRGYGDAAWAFSLCSYHLQLKMEELGRNRRLASRITAADIIAGEMETEYWARHKPPFGTEPHKSDEGR